MPQALADGKTKFSVMTTPPTDFKAPTLAWLNSGIVDAGCRVLKEGFKLGHTDSDEVNESPLCRSGKSTSFSTSNYEGELTVFRYFDLATGKFEETTTGTPGSIGDAVFQAHKVKGTTLWGAVRETSKDATDPWAEGDEVEVYEYTTDSWKRGDGAGFIKRVIKLGVLFGEQNGVVAAAA